MPSASLELERLVVTLLADIKDYVKPMMTAQDVAKQTAATMEAAMKRGAETTRAVETAAERYQRRIGELGDQLNRGAITGETFRRAVQQARTEMENAKESTAGLSQGMQQLAGALEAVGAVKLGQEAFGAFSQFQEVSIRLGGLVRANGEDVKSTMADFQNYAQQVSENTTLSTTQATSLLASAEAMGKTGAAAKQLADDAIAFGAATGQSAEGGIHLALALEMGNVQMLRYSLGLRGVKDEAKILEIAHQRLAAGQKIAEEQAKSSAGQLTVMENQMGNLMIAIGGAISRAINPLVEGLAKVATWLNSLNPALVQVIATVLVAVGVIVLIASNLKNLEIVIVAVRTAFVTTGQILATNPIFLIASAAAIAVTAIIAISAALNDNSKEAQKAADAMDEYKASLERDTAKVRKEIGETDVNAPIRKAERGAYYSGKETKYMNEANAKQTEVDKKMDEISQLQKEVSELDPWGFKRASKETEAKYGGVGDEAYEKAKTELARQQEALKAKKNQKEALDAAATDAAEKAAEANKPGMTTAQIDAWNKLSKGIQDAGTYAKQYGELFGEIGKVIKKGMEEGLQDTEQYKKALADAVTADIDMTEAKIKVQREALDNDRNGIKLSSDQLKVRNMIAAVGSTPELEALKVAVDKLTVDQKSLKLHHEMESPLEKFKLAMGDINEAMKGTDAAAADYQEKLKAILGIKETPLEKFQLDVERLDYAMANSGLSAENYKRGLREVGGFDAQTPLEKYTDRLTILKKEVGANAISHKEFAEGVAKAHKEMDGAAAAAGKLDAVLYGSAEFQARLAAQTEMTRHPFGEAAQAFGAVGGAAGGPNAANPNQPPNAQQNPNVVNFGQDAQWKTEVRLLLVAIRDNTKVVADNQSKAKVGIFGWG